MKNSETNNNKTGKADKVTRESLDKLVYDVVQLFLNKGVTIATAESCTGGLISELITSVPGASKIFEIGVCTYSNKIKHEYLGVPKALFKEYGAVSRQVALAMVAGLQEQSGADICVSVTGTAGPGGGTPEKPVGTVFVGISSGRKRIVKLLKLWELQDKSRDNIRMNAAYRIFEFLKVMVTAMPDEMPDSKVPESNGRLVARELLPWKGDTSSQILRKVVFLGSVVIFTICLFLVVDYYWGNYKNQKLGENLQNIYSEAQKPTLPQTTGVPGEKPTEKVWTMMDGAKKLVEINNDVVGYLKIEDTVIDYPVVQRKQDENNDFYTNHDFDKEEAKAGAIFLDWRNYFDYVVDGTKAFANSQNLVIYGHEMKDGQMFGGLKDYMSADYLADHPIIELSSNYEKYKYKIFAVFIVDADDTTDTKFDCWNKLNFENEKEFYEFVNNARKRSYVFNDVDVVYGDELVSLQTCHSMFESARLYVMGRLVREGEDPYEGTEDTWKNGNRLMPTIYYNWNENNYDPDEEFKEYPWTAEKDEDEDKDADEDE